jgi:transcriptional/translational regulatory protein YebC/TACO1
MARPKSEVKSEPRTAVMVVKATHESIVKLAEQFGISQGSVVEVLVEQADFEKLKPHLIAHKHAKTAALKNPAGVISKKLKTLTPEQLVTVQKLLDSIEAPA